MDNDVTNLPEAEPGLLRRLNATVKAHVRATVAVLGCLCTAAGVAMLTSPGWTLVAVGVLAILGALLSMLPDDQG